MSPPFFFQIDEITESTDAYFNADAYGNWKPSTDHGANIDITPTVGASGRVWFCDGQHIYEKAQLPAGAELYKTYSAYYVGGVGFSILKGDARLPPPSEAWHSLKFAYCNETDYSSYLTNAGQWQTIRLQPHDRRWADLLLPSINHTHVKAGNTNHGGIVGELPIFLALMAFTTSREYLPSVLPYTFIRGQWMPTHSWRMERIDRRGVVVTVYTCPKIDTAGTPLHSTGSSARDLYDYETGLWGKYYN